MKKENKDKESTKIPEYHYQLTDLGKTIKL